MKATARTVGSLVATPAYGVRLLGESSLSGTILMGILTESGDARIPRVDFIDAGARRPVSFTRAALTDAVA